MRVLFAGSPDIAVPSLEKIAEKYKICGVLTNPDRVSGRGKKIKMTAVKQKGLELNLNILQPERLNSEFREVISSLKPDILVTAAYGKIFGPKFLQLFPLGGINLHPSLLPLYRGSSPITTAILNGDKITGITIQQIAQAVDSGDILLQRDISLKGDETTQSLTEYAAGIGSEMILSVLENINCGNIISVKQDDNCAVFCSKINKEDGIIDWKDTAFKINCMVRAYNPWPSAMTEYAGMSLKILETVPYRGDFPEKKELPGLVLGIDRREGILVQTGDGILAVKKLQLQSKKSLDWKPFINGVSDFEGSILGGTK